MRSTISVFNTILLLYINLSLSRNPFLALVILAAGFEEVSICILNVISPSFVALSTVMGRCGEAFVVGLVLVFSCLGTAAITVSGVSVLSSGMMVRLA